MFFRCSRQATSAWTRAFQAVFISSSLMGVATGVSLAAEPDTAWSSFQNGGAIEVGFSLPTVWSAEPDSLAWSVELTGYGQSSPVIFQSKVYLTSTSGANKEQFHVLALDLETGKQLWQTDFVNPTPEENNSYVSRAAPSPVVDTRGLYVFNEGGVLAGLEFDGQIKWQRDLVAEFGPIKARHGIASSLEHNAEHLFVWVERGEEPYLMAVSKATGETVWKIPGLGSTTWGSPRLITVGDSQHLVCSAIGKVVGFDPKSGKQLWALEGVANNSSSTPIPTGDGQFFIGASDGRGEETGGQGASSNGLVKITSSSDGTYAADYVWRADKATCSFGSPVVAGGRVWIVNRTGALYQLDLETGEQLEVSRLKAGSIWATPLADEKHIFFFGQKGTTSVLDLSDGSEIATNQLWDIAGGGEVAAMGGSVQYAAVAAEGYLLLRRGDRLYAVR